MAGYYGHIDHNVLCGQLEELLPSICPSGLGLDKHPEKTFIGRSVKGFDYVFGVPSGNWVDYMAAIEEIDCLEFILISNEGSG